MSKLATGKSHQATPYMGRERKEKIIAEVSDKVGRAKAMVFTNYEGLTHHQLETLKRAAKKVDADYVATKNTLLKRSLDTLGTPDTLDTLMQGPTATLFAYGDPIEPIKALAKMIKELKLPLIKFGILEGKPLTSSEVERLATLPALPQLRAQLVGTLNSPIQGLHRALSWNMQKFVMTLSAMQAKKA